MKLYELSALIIKIGFCATFLTNAVFITLTLFYTRKITGTYRKLLAIFAATCIIFSAIEVISQPCIHNFNGGMIYFSLNSDSDSVVFVSQRFQTIAIIFYASCYASQLTFIAIQFIFRTATLTGHPIKDTFQGGWQLIWIFDFLATGTMYGLIVDYCLATDDYSDNYFRQEFMSVYGRNVSSTPRVQEVPYDEHGNLRWRILVYFFSEFMLLDSQYVIIIFCGIKMRKAMKTKLQNLSRRNRKLESQFFKALSVQILLPTFLLTLPIGIVLSLPFLDLKLSFQSQVAFALYSLYPPLDSIATMVIVTEYKTSLRGSSWRIYRLSIDRVMKSGTKRQGQ